MSNQEIAKPLYENIYWRTMMSVVPRPPKWDPVRGRMTINPGTDYRVTGAEYVALFSDGRFTLGEWIPAKGGDFQLDGRLVNGRGTYQLFPNNRLILEWSSGEQSQGSLGSGYEELCIFGKTYKLEGSYVR